MNTKQHENGLGTLAFILLLIVPLAIWILYDWQSAMLWLFFGLIVVGAASVAKGDYANN